VLETFSFTIRRRRTSFGRIWIRGAACPFTSVTAEKLLSTRLSCASTCWMASRYSRIPYACVSESSSLPSMRKAPDIPLLTCSATEPCL
jgi:hypothetical protein